MVKLPEHAAVDRIGEALSDDDRYGPEIEGKCNGRIDSGDKGSRRCTLPAGQGTDHKGFGKCKHHFGATAVHSRKAVRQVYEAEFARQIRFGELIDTDPMAGILTEISRTAGFIAYLERIIGDKVVDGQNDQVALVYQDSFGGVHIEPAVAIWRAERSHFARCCKMAGDLGIASAIVDMARVMGDKLAELLELIVRDLGRDPDDPEVERVIRARLTLLRGESA